MIILDDTDQSFVSSVISHCIAVLDDRMTDAKVCEENRDRAREFHKMAIKARRIVIGTEAR